MGNFMDRHPLCQLTPMAYTTCGLLDAVVASANTGGKNVAAP